MIVRFEHELSGELCDVFSDSCSECSRNRFSPGRSTGCLDRLRVGLND